MAAAIGSPSHAVVAAAAALSCAAAAPSPQAVLRVAPASGAQRGTTVVAVAMRPAKAAVAAEAPSAVENGVVVAGMARPDTMGRFGRFGGKYVPKTLMHVLTELEKPSTRSPPTRSSRMQHLIGFRDCHLGGFDLSIALAPHNSTMVFAKTKQQQQAGGG